MTLAEFKKDFYCVFEVVDQNIQHLKIATTLKTAAGGMIVDGITTTIDIQQTRDWINSSTLTWPMLLEKTKRAQLDFFAMSLPIDNFFPLNMHTFPIIDDLYR